MFELAATSVDSIIEEKEINPMEWTILLGQFGGFWVIVGVVFNLFYVPKAFMVPRWKKDSADIEEEKFHVSGPNFPHPQTSHTPCATRKGPH